MMRRDVPAARMRNTFTIASIRGIAISVHWSWLLAIVIITWSLGGYYSAQFPQWGPTAAVAIALLSAVLLFVTVLLHELAHSFTARANGLPVNSITLFIFGGISNLTQEPQLARVEFLVAIAGPLASLALAGLFYVLHAVTGGLPSEVSALLGYLASVNLILALFNLIPGFPLDGGRVFRSITWMVTGNRRRSTQIASNVGQAIGFLFILGGLYQALFLKDIVSGIWLAFIGWFLNNAAGAGYQQAVMDNVLRGVAVRDVMDRAPVPVAPTLDVETLVYEHMLGRNQRALPIANPDGRLRGIVTMSDVQKLSRERWTSTPVTEIMTRAADLHSVAPDQDLGLALQSLARNNYHQVPVLEDGRLVGILDRSHVVQYVHLRSIAQRDEQRDGAASASRSSR